MRDSIVFLSNCCTNLIFLRKLDPQNQGWISHQTLLEALISHGDDPLSTEFIKTLLLEDQKFNDADRFDYNSFCTYVFDTSAKLVTAAKERAAAAEAEKEFNSRTYKVSSAMTIVTAVLWALSRQLGGFHRTCLG